MKIGIRDGCLRKPPLEALALAGELGFDGVELCIGATTTDHILWQVGGFDQVTNAAELAGVVVSSLSPGDFANCHPLVEDPALREHGHQLILQCIERCGLVGASSILVPMFPKDMADWPDTTWQALADGFKPLAAVAAKANIVLALESTFSAEQLNRLLDLVDNPALAVYYDTANTTNRGYHCPTELRELGDRVGMVHVKDTEQRHLGDGRVPWADCRTALRDIRYDGWLVLETPAGDDAARSGARNYGFTRGWVA